MCSSIQCLINAPAPAVLGLTSTSRQAAPVQAGNGGHVSDAVQLSTVAVLLAALEYQLSNSSPGDFKTLLEGAASAAYSAAEQEPGLEQSSALENVANRLRFAASASGLSSGTALSLDALL